MRINLIDQCRPSASEFFREGGFFGGIRGNSEAKVFYIKL